jgi:hypothetical protein
MKHCVWIFLALTLNSFSQDLHHQMLSSQGTSKTLPNGIFVSQTVGQLSVSGNYTVDNKTFGQGYQQSFWSRYISSNVTNSITTVVYPNPFISSINFQFSKPIIETISVSLFDIRGRLIFAQKKQSIGNILSVDLPNLASSNYLVLLTATNYTFYTQIFKQ